MLLSGKYTGTVRTVEFVATKKINVAFSKIIGADMKINVA